MTTPTWPEELAIQPRELAQLLGVSEVSAIEVTELPYAFLALTTGSRWCVDVTTPTGPLALVVKVARDVRRSPVFSLIPAELAEAAARGLPWEIEPNVYRSELGSSLPQGMSLPCCYHVHPIDDASSAIWMERIAHTETWTPQIYADAALMLGRFAASSEVGQVADTIGHPSGPQQARVYYEGRLRPQFVDAFTAGEIWAHPVVSRHVDSALRARLFALVDLMPTLIDEIEALPLLSAHGDACPSNLLSTGEGTFTVIDWAFFGRARIGFDLTQLVISAIDLGQMSADRLPQLQDVCVSRYRSGLAGNGFHIDRDSLARAHRIQLAAFSALSAIPLEQLPPGDSADPSLHSLVHERMRALDHILRGIGI
ncbi:MULTISPECIES: phosphotransferase [unclassified Gordonia (in: high G+C Gram-positive bacteria)]|uniref:phosphotransferase n=1 Tax=unclassified Gordonia (in: high G+C Gram-positive bacteria) TaxID=2657482 RepID=UPI001F0F96B4|nr:phosphotransferase [Gordonia sp. ABSL49_1]MCH5642548.1 phosphotransferase [Gordonia sp. ABSL49_1]